LPGAGRAVRLAWPALFYPWRAATGAAQRGRLPFHPCGRRAWRVARGGVGSSIIHFAQSNQKPDCSEPALRKLEFGGFAAQRSVNRAREYGNCPFAPVKAR
jgi:hypothetical protein